MSLALTYSRSCMYWLIMPMLTMTSSGMDWRTVQNAHVPRAFRECVAILTRDRGPHRQAHLGFEHLEKRLHVLVRLLHRDRLDLALHAALDVL